MSPSIAIIAAQTAMQAIELAFRLREQMKREGKMTPQEDAEFDRIMQSRMEAIHWRPSE
jgi:hypothetical protein